MSTVWKSGFWALAAGAALAADAQASDALLGCYSLQGPKGAVFMAVARRTSGYEFTTFGKAKSWTSPARVATPAGANDLSTGARRHLNAAVRVTAALESEGDIVIGLVEPALRNAQRPEWGSTPYVALDYMIDTTLLFKVPCPPR